jgi:hypothetical protein
MRDNMSETSEMKISMVDGVYTLRDEHGADVVTLMVGSVSRYSCVVRGARCVWKAVGTRGGIMSQLMVSVGGWQ